MPLMGVEAPEVFEPLEVIHREGLRIITGALKSTPKSLLYSVACTPPLMILTQQIAGQFLVNFQTNPNQLTKIYYEWNGDEAQLTPLGAFAEAQNYLISTGKTNIEIRRRITHEEQELLFKCKFNISRNKKHALKLITRNKLIEPTKFSLYTDGGYSAKVGKITTGFALLEDTHII